MDERIIIGDLCIYTIMIDTGDEGGWPLAAAIIYTTAWCLSFYGQIYENYRLKSVEGFSLNYFAFSLTGYTYYAIYLSVGAFTDLQGAGTIVIADLFFIYHTVLVIAIQLTQCIIYEKGKNRLAKKTLLVILCVTAVIVVQTLLTVGGVVDWYQYWNPLTVVGYGKLLMTLIKCTPQVYWNYERKSTKGWSIAAILLDLTGGAFSFASGGISLQNGLNITKTLLGGISVIYDLIFCFQHYVLYRQSPLPRHQINRLSESLLVPDGSLVVKSQKGGKRS